MTARVLICGSRHWTDEGPIREVLAGLHSDAVIIHGAANGADALADSIARALGFAVERYPAEWKRLGRIAGPIRNRRMIKEGSPTIAYAFPLPSSINTIGMIKLLRDAGVQVNVVRSALGVK